VPSFVVVATGISSVVAVASPTFVVMIVPRTHCLFSPSSLRSFHMTGRRIKRQDKGSKETVRWSCRCGRHSIKVVKEWLVLSPRIYMTDDDWNRWINRQDKGSKETRPTLSSYIYYWTTYISNSCGRDEREREESRFYRMKIMMLWLLAVVAPWSLWSNLVLFVRRGRHRQQQQHSNNNNYRSWDGLRVSVLVVALTRERGSILW